MRNQRSDDPTLENISKAHNKTIAQVLIRYALQKQWIPLPKSETPSRIAENSDVFDFALTKEEMSLLDDLDEGEAGAIVCVVKNEPVSINVVK